VIEVHRIRFASKRPQARPARKRRNRERRPHALHFVLGVTHDGFASMGNQVIARPVFLLASVELAFQRNSKKIMGAEGRSRTGVKTSLVASGAGFSVMMVPSPASS
jgi:hypothetical protein